MPWLDVANNAASSQAPMAVGTGLYNEPYGTTARSFPRYMCTSAIAPSPGVLNLRLMVLPQGYWAGAMTMYTGATAKTGGTHGWYVITDQYINVLAVTADQTDPATTWGTINSPQDLPFTGAGLSCPYTGYYYAGFMIAESAGTMPTLATATVSLGVSNQVPAMSVSGGVGLTTPPAVGANLVADYSSTSTSSWYVGLSAS